MAKIPKRIICLATIAVILCAHVPIARAEALPNVLSGSSTVADIVMSYYAMGGAAVANTDWINTLYDSLGSNLGTIQSFAENGYLVTNPDGTWYATQALEQAIENAPAYQSLGLDEIFNVSAQEAAAGGGLAASTGAATLAGATGAVGSVGILPLLGGVTAAYWGGIGIGTIVAHLIGLYGDNIEHGIPISLSEMLNDVPQGNGCTCYSFYRNSTVNSNRIDYCDGKMWLVVDPSGIYERVIYNKNLNSVGVYYKETGYWNNSGLVRNISLSNGVATLGYGINQNDPEYSNWSPVAFNFYNNTSGHNSYLSGLRSGEISPYVTKSPDIIGPDGNQQAEEDENGQYQIPYMLPQVDPSVQSGKPLTMEDWLRFANGAKSNNSDPEGKTKNKKLFDDILDEIRQGVPSTPDNPDPDPDPYHPPTPTPVPDPDYGDPNPDQPEFESETDIPDPVDTGNPWVTPDLLDKFPFCIPKDMIDMVKGFKSADRTAPHISWNFKSPVGHVDYTFNLDLEDFEDVATLLRALELAAFIVGLAFATRYLIGAS